jgi:hypothetical protein
MSQRNSEFWKRARRARDKLADQYLEHPQVSLIDIGNAPAEQRKSSEEVVLRVHVRESWLEVKPEERVTFPEQIDGIPIIVIPGDYRLESGL